MGTNLTRSVAVSTPLLAVLLAAGCNTGQSAAAPDTHPTAVSATSSSAVTSTASTESDTGRSSATASTTTTPARPHDPECKVPDLSINLGGQIDATQQRGNTIIFSNISNHPCLMVGYPGVSFTTGGTGTQVGAAADRQGPKGTQVVLAPGQDASAAVQWLDADHLDESICQPVPVGGFQVYPPDETSSMFVPLPADVATACSVNPQGTDLWVSTMVAGDGQPGDAPGH